MDQTKAAEASESAAVVVPMGWTAEQLAGCSEALNDRVVRAVRAAEADGWRLRCGNKGGSAKSIALIVLNERGEPARMKQDDGTSTALCEAVQTHLTVHGLAVRTVGHVALGVSVATEDEVATVSDEESQASTGRKRAAAK